MRQNVVDGANGHVDAVLAETRANTPAAASRDGARTRTHMTLPHMVV